MKKIISPKIIRILMLCLAVLVQVAVILLPYFFFRRYLVHLTWVLEILSLWVVLYLIRSDINPVYKIPWIVILLVFPAFGGILYIIYGRVHFSKKEIRRFTRVAESSRHALMNNLRCNEELRETNHYIAVQADYLLEHANAPLYKNTGIRYFPLGDYFFPVLLEELKAAKKYIFMEYFIIEEGKMFDSIVEVLEQKAAEGLDVRFAYDSLGSIFKAPVDIVKKLKSKGIRCMEFNSFRSIMDSRYNNRDHRKICVIDGNTAFTGGVNLADEYINEKVLYGHWKDNAIMFKGDAVRSFTIMFLTLWDSTQSEIDDYSEYFPDVSYTDAGGYVAPYTDYTLDKEPVGKNVYLNMINRANKYLYIMSPYLILDNELISALVNAAKNGIDVRIITPGVPDKRIVYMLTQSYYEVIIEAGVKIYEYRPGFVHSKVFLSDDETAVVGTINLDYRSLTHHFENAVWMYDVPVLKDIKEDFIDTFAKCEEITLEKSRKKSLIRRILLPILRLFSPMF